MLVLPLAIPLLIFGVAATDAAVTGEIPFARRLALCAISLSSLYWADRCAAALRYARE